MPANVRYGVALFAELPCRSRPFADIALLAKRPYCVGVNAARTDRFFWPALTGAWLAAITVAAELAFPQSIEPALQPLTVVLGGFAALMFMVVLLDRQTRQAVNIFNATTAAELAKRKFFAHLFAPEWGDRRLVIVNRLVWLEAACAIFVGRQDLALLSFVSFALSTMMAMLGLKAKIVA